MRLNSKIAVFSIMVLTTHLLLIYGFKTFVNKNSKLLITQNEYEKMVSDKIPAYLFAGDSHCARSVNDSIIENSFNIGYYGENNIRTYYRLKYLLENFNNKPEIIFLQAELSRFAKHFCRFNINNFFYKKYVDEFELMQNDNYDHSYLLSSLKYSLFPYVEWKELMKKNTETKEEKNSIEFSSVSEEERKRATYQFVRRDLLQFDSTTLFDELGMTYLQKSIDLCKEHHIKLIFIKYPSTDYFINEFVSYCGAEKVKDPPQDKIIKENGLEIWDYEQYFSNRYELFFDSHHMNAKGKKEFSLLLNERIKKELTDK